jgi:hypothetical protein
MHLLLVAVLAGSLLLSIVPGQAGTLEKVNFYKPFYLTAEGDVGCFGIGSEITCQAYGAVGCQITRNIFSEVGYRFLYADYDTTSLVYQVAMHGAQITVGLNF